MDFKLTDEQELIVDSYREYMESENWETYFHECDEKHVYPLRWVAGLCELGFDQIMLPESHGGLGLEQPCVTLMAVYEVLGRYGAPTYVLYQLPGFETIIREGTQEQIDAVMSTLGSGEQIWNSACTEPGAGSDVGALATTYKRENGKIYLNGTKTFITSSKGVKWLVVMAKNADDPTMFTEFFLDMSKPGVKLSPLPKLGLRMDSCCEVYLDNVELEESDIFGKEGNGFMRGVSDFNFERWLVGACDYGTAICAFEDAMKHANTRIAFGKPISRFQLNSLKITEMCIKLTNMRNMLYEAAWMADNNGGDFDPAMAAMCKYYCANASFEVTDDAMQVMGGIAEGNRTNVEGQIDFFGMGAETAQQAALVLPDIPEFTPQELMAMEKATTGLYLTGHPMDAYRSLVRSSGAAAIGRVMEDFAQEAGPTTFSDGQKISLAGVVTASKTKMTKKNTLMAYVTLEDGTGAIEMLCFTRALEQYGSYLQEGQVIYVTGTLSVRDEKAPQLMCDFARPLNANFSTGTAAPAQAPQQRTGQTLYLRLPSVDGPEMAILRKILYMFEGKENNVRIRVLDTGKLIGTTCDLHTSLVCDLEERFGKENVVVK